MTTAKDIPDKKEGTRNRWMIVRSFLHCWQTDAQVKPLRASYVEQNFLAGIIPIAAYILLHPTSHHSVIDTGQLNRWIFLSVTAQKNRVNWKIIFAETLVIVIIATICIVGFGCSLDGSSFVERVMLSHYTFIHTLLTCFQCSLGCLFR